jgi:anti-anti-sigma factor
MDLVAFEVEKTVKKDTVVLKLTGALDTETRLQLAPYIDPLKSDPNLREVIFNLDRVTHMDSRGLSTLLSLHRHFTERDINFRLVNVHDYVMRLLQVSNLSNLFEIGPPPESEALLVHDRREALWQSHAFTTQLITALGEAVFGVDADGRVLFANPAAERLLGWEEADLLGRPLTEVIQPFDASGEPVTLDPNGAGGSDASPVTRLEAALLTKSGEPVEVEIVATTIFQYGHRIGRVLGIRDLRQRKQAQSELKRLATVVEQTAEMIVVTDPDGIIQYVNPAFERITGYSREEAVNTPTSLFHGIVQDGAFRQNLWETLKSGKVWTGRLTNRRKDGQLYEEEATISPVQDSSGNTINFVCVKRDITQEALLEQQLRDSQKFEAIAQLAGGIAHDFNNLLTSVIGNIQLARVRPQGDIQGYLARAEQACMRGASLVQQLLLYSRKSPSEKQVITLNLIVREVVALARETIDRRIEIETHLMPDLPRIIADPTQMHQVLLNLVVNARDAIEEVRSLAGEEEGIPAARASSPKITICTESISLAKEGPALDVLGDPGDYTVLSVSDTGTGMDAKTQEHLFEPFFTTKEVGKGTGLGLATAYGIVRNHGGWIEIESERDRGSTFKIYLPVAQGGCKEAARSEDSGEPKRGSETILVVDDETSICDVARDTLESYGYTVLAANDGEKGLEVYAREMSRIDLVILDLSMPKLSGREVLERIREINPHARVIISSGYLTGDIQAVASGCIFVQKPFRVDSLLRVVRRALDQSPAAPSKPA